MGFESAQIVEALETAKGDLEIATAFMFGESVAPIVPAPKAPVQPMRLVGKQPAPKVVAVKPDYKEVHRKFMSTYKIEKCKEKGNHDKRMCIFYHSNGDRRRNPFTHPYTCVECPGVDPESGTCDAGDSCLKAHNMLERMFHPELFKISYCQRGANGQTCDRGALCAFAHSEEDHRVPLSQTLARTAGQSGAYTPSAASSAAPAPSAAPAEVSTSKSPSGVESTQEKLLRLIKSHGGEGIISSELPKRYLDAYGERLDLSGEGGEKFRIKDLLAASPAVSVVMHKGVQPRYVYEEAAATAATATPTTPTTATPAASSTSSAKPAVVSYASLASGAMSYSSATSKPAAAPAAAVPTPVTAVRASPPVEEKPAAEAAPASTGRSARRRGPSESDVAPVAPQAAAPATAFQQPAAPVAAPQQQAGGARRRGPDAAGAEQLAAPQVAVSPEVALLQAQVASLKAALVAKTNEAERLQDAADEEIRQRDATIAQLRSEKSVELSNFAHNLQLVETALVEAQRKESICVNEMPPMETLARSARARDELTKFVSMLRAQLQTKGAPESSVAAAPIANVTKSTLSNFLNANGINGTVVRASTVETAVHTPHQHVHAASTAAVATAAAAAPVVANTLMCSLPGCNMEGSFICSACGKAGYCGEDHQR